MIEHTVDQCRKELNLCRLDDRLYLWHFGDYPIYCAFSKIPEYDYYLQIEYDVDIGICSSHRLDGVQAAESESVDVTTGPTIQALGDPAPRPEFAVA